MIARHRDAAIYFARLAVAATVAICLFYLIAQFLRDDSHPYLPETSCPRQRSKTAA